MEKDPVISGSLLVEGPRIVVFNSNVALIYIVGCLLMLPALISSLCSPFQARSGGPELKAEPGSWVW